MQHRKTLPQDFRPLLVPFHEAISPSHANIEQYITL
jgi:hypothetical protein